MILSSSTLRNPMQKQRKFQGENGFKTILLPQTPS
ncbi:MAG: hypothetical protein ACJAYJ_004588 [Saprospiraceae bacterium]|jgi:hypothetical protein